MSRLAPLALALFLLPLLLVGPARAEDESAPLVVRAFPVGALTQGRTDFIPPQPPTVRPGMVSDEESPLFGAEGEEPILPCGTVDEVIELVKNAVSPWFWEERMGADIRSMGERWLIARATPEVLDRIGDFLAHLEQMNGAVVTVDVHALRLTQEERGALGTGAVDPAKVAALLDGPDAGPSVSLSACAGSRATGYAGVRRSWVGDADVEVAENSKNTDPIVEVANLGLIVSVLGVPAPDGKTVLVGLDAALSGLADDETAETGATGTIETPVFDLLEVRSAVLVATGAWTLVDGSTSDWTFLVRATARTETRARGGVDLPAIPGRAIGPLQVRYFPVHVLTTAARPVVAYAPIPVPSNYTPLEPPELPEPYPFVPEEAIVDLLRESGGEESWEDPATIEVRNRMIIARNTADVLDGLAAYLDVLRDGFVWSMDVTVEVVEAPYAVARHLGTGGALDERALRLLQEALLSGQATRLDAATVTSLVGARNSVAAGRLVSYVQDYEVEIAQGATIFNPVVLHFLDGFSADVTPAPTADRKAAQLTLRIRRTDQPGELRTHRSGPVPEIQLPEVETFELNTELIAPLGRTSVAAVWGAGGGLRLLLVTPRFR